MVDCKKSFTIFAAALSTLWIDIFLLSYGVLMRPFSMKSLGPFNFSLSPVTPYLVDTAEFLTLSPIFLIEESGLVIADSM